MQVLKQVVPAKQVHETPLGGRSSGWAQRFGWGRSRQQLSAYTAPVAYLGLFLGSGPLLEEIDPGMELPDVGLIRLVPLALLLVTVAQRASAGVYKSLVESLGDLPPWQRTLCYALLYVSKFWAVLWIIVALSLL